MQFSNWSIYMQCFSSFGAEIKKIVYESVTNLRLGRAGLGRAVPCLAVPCRAGSQPESSTVYTQTKTPTHFLS